LSEGQPLVLLNLRATSEDEKWGGRRRRTFGNSLLHRDLVLPPFPLPFSSQVLHDDPLLLEVCLDLSIPKRLDLLLPNDEIHTDVELLKELSFFCRRSESRGREGLGNSFLLRRVGGRSQSKLDEEESFSRENRHVGCGGTGLKV